MVVTVNQGEQEDGKIIPMTVMLTEALETRSERTLRRQVSAVLRPTVRCRKMMVLGSFEIILTCFFGIEELLTEFISKIIHVISFQIYFFLQL